MGLLDRLFGGKAVKPPRLCAYGKMPFYGDFLSLRTDTPAGRRFREWLDKGFANRSGRGPLVGTPQRMLFAPAGGVQEAVVAALWDSRDQGGTRQFPIALFVEVPAARLLGPTPGLFGRLQGIWADLAAICEEAAPSSSASDFYARFDETTLPEVGDEETAQAGFGQELSEIPLAEWLSSLVGEAGMRGGLAVLLATLNAFRDAPDTAAVRLPISPRLGVSLQMDLWATLAARTDGADPERVLPNLWMPLDDAAGVSTGCLALRELRPADAALFAHKPAGSAEDAWWRDLTALEEEPEGLEPFAERLWRDLLGHNAAMAELLTYRLPGLR